MTDSLDINWLSGHTCFYCQGPFVPGQYVEFRRIEDMDGQPTGIGYHKGCNPFQQQTTQIGE